VLLMSWSTFRDRWPVFAGSIVTVCIGVALVQAALLSLITSVTADIPAGLPLAEERALRTGYTFATVVLSQILGVSAFVAVFIVSSTFAFTVAQRRRDLALLRVNGASKHQVRVLLLGEALLLGVVGSVLGMLVGLPVMRLLAWMLAEFEFVPPGFAGQWRPWVIAVSLGAGVGVALCGVLAASARAAKVRPMEALRDTGDASRVMTRTRWIVGIIAVTGGVVEILVAPFVRGEAALTLSMWVLFTFVIASAVLAPLLVGVVSRPFGFVFRGRLGQLAHANLRTGVRRSASTAAPIMVLAGFIAGVGGIVATLGDAGREDAARSLRADLVVTTPGPALPQVSGTPGVAVAAEEVPVPFDVALDESDPSAYDIADGVAIDPATYVRTHDVDVSAGDLAALRGDTVAVSPAYSPGMGWDVGGTIRVKLDGEPRDLRIVALLPDTLAGPFFLMPMDLAPEGGERSYAVVVADGADPGTVAAGLASAGEVVSADEWVRRTAEAQQSMDIKVMIALLALAMAYTVVAMINAVVISASERGTEFAVARVVGLTRAQVVRAALLESVGVVAIGLILGAVCAAATVLSTSVNVWATIGVGTVQVQWPILGLVAVGVTLVVAATTALAAYGATRTPPIRLATARE
jgi:putative ABC transport system permease protein